MTSIVGPGFSSRSTVTHVSQLPQRDEAAMSDHEPGFSNSAPVEGDEAKTSVKVVKTDDVEDKAVKPTESKRASRRNS